MGINKRYPLKDLMKVLREYVNKTNRQVTFEYILIKNINDRKKDAEDLAALIKGMLAKVNLLPLNPVEGMNCFPPGAPTYQPPAASLS